MSEGNKKLITTIRVNIFTKKTLSEWRKLNYPRERMTYDQIIQRLLEESARKDTNRIKFNLTPLEKIVLSLVGENKDTSRAIHDELILQEYNTTQRSVENALESLRRKKLLDREILKGREYRYFLIDKI